LVLDCGLATSGPRQTISGVRSMIVNHFKNRITLYLLTAWLVVHLFIFYENIFLGSYYYLVWDLLSWKLSIFIYFVLLVSHLLFCNLSVFSRSGILLFTVRSIFLLIGYRIISNEFHTIPFIFSILLGELIYFGVAMKKNAVKAVSLKQFVICFLFLISSHIGSYLIYPLKYIENKKQINIIENYPDDFKYHRVSPSQTLEEFINCCKEPWYPSEKPEVIRYHY
jgi:membrane-bound ClpP family serine protease